MPLSEGLILRKRWVLSSFVAEGACAKIWNVSSSSDASSSWVAKIVPEPPLVSVAKKKRRKPTEQEKNAISLSWEHSLYHGILRGHPRVPAVPLRDSYGTDQGLCFLVMERLGPTLREVLRLKGGRFEPSMVAHYGRQMLEALRECHKRKLLFVDVKPDNFMVGTGAKAEFVFIADFGVAEKYIDAKGGHREETGGCFCGAAGTPTYQSVRVQSGASACARRDDLEALGYVLAEFAVDGELPWATARSEKVRG
mmetsp:Transcript_35348/g.79747  ORF Transcript_35348/g.79747 Transcript_35348/m.79747 type:complete len:253 (+) Transcript_35348:52-810(+)